MSALPRLAEALLQRCIRDRSAREGIIGDLREEYAQMAATHRLPLVWLWSWFASIGIAIRYRREQRRVAAVAGVRDLTRGGKMERNVNELGRAIRSLRQQPLFAAVVVLTLALGIGANTVVFTVVDSVLLTPLPYPQAERLVRLYNFYDDGSGRGSAFVVGPAFAAYRGLDDVFDGLATEFTYREVGADLVTGERPVRVTGMPVSAGLFETLGIDLAIGREFARDEENGARLAILGHGLWQTAFAADPQVLGRAVELDGVPYTVVGVAPSGFRNPLGWQVDLWIPEDLQSPGRNSWENNYLSVVGRLRPGMTVAAANERLDALSASLNEQELGARGMTARIVPLIDDTVGGARSMLYALTAAVSMVLLVACVNVASLFLVRGTERGHDFAVRAALGAGRADLLREMLYESLLLGGAGGVAGLALSLAGVRAIVGANPDLPRLAEVGIDVRILGFTLVVSGLTALLFSALPALRLSRPDLDSTLRRGTRGTSRARGQRRARNALVVTEIALAVMLLAGAGLLLKSLSALSRADLGFRPDNVLTFSVHLPTLRYAEPEQRIAFFERWFERVRTIPGVEAVGATSYLPTEGRYHRWNFARPDIDPDQRPDVERDNRMVTGDYFEALGIDLVRGRVFGAQDTADGPRAVILNRYLAERGFPDRDPLGAKIIQMGREWEVVGIVDDTAHDARGSVVGKIYYPHEQFAWNRNWELVQTVRTGGDPAALVGPLREALREQDPQLILYHVRTMADVVGRGTSPQRFTATLMSLFAGVALALAALGIYGVLASDVAGRARELGIRMALGADRRRVRALVLGHGARLTALGITLGAGGGLILSRWLSSLLFEVQPRDPWVLAAVALVIAAAATLAAYLPARRATSIDPLRALS